MPDTHPVRIETLIANAASRHPKRAALIFSARRWTYGQLHAETERRAALLVAAGLMPGDVVGIAEPMSDDVVIAFFACCRAGIVPLYLSPNLTAAELTPLVVRSAAKRMLRVVPAPHPALPDLPVLPLALPGVPTDHMPHHLAAHDADAVACLRTTSGTTGGMAKLVVSSHRMITWRYATGAWAKSPGGVYYFPQTTFFPIVDFCTVFGIGDAIILSHAMEPTRIEAEMAAHRATSLWSVPAVIRLLVAQSRPCPTGLMLREVRTGAAPLAPDVEQAVMVRYGARLSQKYASTEGGSMIGTPRDGAPVGSIGAPFPGVETRLVDVKGRDVPEGGMGELIVRSPGIMCGYLDDAEATAQAVHDGWLWTGDLARRDADGFYFLEGRRALRINVGGFKVTPEEVEAVLERHPAVREVVVMGIPDATRGEIVRAVIVSRGERPTVRDLRRFCRERLAGYKVPRHWEFRDDLPRSPLGKVLRHKL
ncbi:MAG: AMP-binding protein [Chloroflexota bacterium]|nr:AMP-binding protein [Chloroflexota bacterium]